MEKCIYVYINIYTYSYSFHLPLVHHSDYFGCYQNTLPSTIGPSEEGSALFTKTPDTACGAVGVFTFELYNQSTKTVDKKMAVMFSNPYSFDFFYNLYAVGLFDKNQLCEYSLYHKMYYNAGKEFVRHRAGYPLTYEGDGLIISASMTDTYEPELDVIIRSIDG
uniref:Uncharacterized protein n=1 Tax=Acanthochromis polyacanthus TaxID=80966 RepID=A0A3Q1FX06_9TELE